MSDLSFWVPNAAMSHRGTGEFTSPYTVKKIGLEHLNPVDLTKRKRRLDEAAIKRLMQSIREHGVMQPIGVRATRGNDGPPYDLIYGLHRVVASSRLAEEDERHSAVPGVVYPHWLPDWEIELKEIAENLHRLDLTNEERAAHAGLYIAILKEQNQVQQKGIAGRKSSTTVDNKKPTPSQAAGQLLGRSSGATEQVRKHQDANRGHAVWNRAVKNAGLSPVSLDKGTAEQLRATAEAIKDKLPEIAERKTAKRQAGLAAQPNKPEKAPRPTDAPRGIVTSTANLHPMERDRLVGLLNIWEDDWGTGGVQRVVETWWRRHYPPGRVVWNKEHGE